MSFVYLVTLSYNSTVKNGFYIGQPLTVRCKALYIPEAPNFFMLHLRVGDTHNIDCDRETTKWYFDTFGRRPADVNYTDLTRKDCHLLEKNNTMSVEFIITEGLKNLNITCVLYLKPEVLAARYSDSSLVIRETKCE